MAEEPTTAEVAVEENATAVADAPSEAAVDAAADAPAASEAPKSETVTKEKA